MAGYHPRKPRGGGCRGFSRPTVRQTNKHAKRNCKAGREQARMRCTTLLGRKVRARDVQWASTERGRVARCRPPGRWTLRASWAKRNLPEPAERRSIDIFFKAPVRPMRG